MTEAPPTMLDVTMAEQEFRDTYETTVLMGIAYRDALAAAIAHTPNEADRVQLVMLMDQIDLSKHARQRWIDSVDAYRRWCKEDLGRQEAERVWEGKQPILTNMDAVERNAYDARLEELRNARFGA